MRTLQAWRERGATVHCGQHGLKGLATCTFGRAVFILKSEMLESGCEMKPRADGPPKDWLYSYSIAEYKLTIPLGGVHELRLASVHFNCTYVQKWEVARDAIAHFLEKCLDHRVDLIGGGFNQAVRFHHGHTETSLQLAFAQVFAGKEIECPTPYDQVFGQAPDDVCGFIVMPGSELSETSYILKASYANYLEADVGVRDGDSDAHYPVQCWLRHVDFKRDFSLNKRSSHVMEMRSVQRKEKSVLGAP